MFAEALGGLHELQRAKLQVFATDIDAAAIDVGRKGYYASPALEEVTEKLLYTYFDSVAGGYLAKKTVRDKIVFSVHNLTEDPHLSDST